MDDLLDYSLQSAPPTVYYIPNFITKEEESHILDKVYSVPKPKWTCLSNRRLQDYGGVPHKNGMIVEKIPVWLESYMERITQLNVFQGSVANHVLVNEYLPGQGIMPHSDGPLFFPTITTISCGSSALLEFCMENTREKVCTILLEPRSLVVLKDDMYTKYLHSIREVTEDEITKDCINLNECNNRFTLGESIARKTRISLTIRNVLKVSKIKLWNL